jgi:hypothetical protein
MTVSINEDVVWLDISMNVVHSVHIFESEKKFSDIEASLLLGKNVFLYQQPQQVTSWNPLHSDIEMVAVLEG